MAAINSARNQLSSVVSLAQASADQKIVLSAYVRDARLPLFQRAAPSCSAPKALVAYEGQASLRPQPDAAYTVRCG